MNLTRRQKDLYKHLVDIWRDPMGVDPQTLKPLGEALERVAEDIPCYIEYNPNVDTSTEAGRLLASMIFTTDRIHLPADVDIQNGDYTLNKTPGPNFGQVHRTLGEPQQNPTVGRRDTNKQMVMAMIDLKPPAEIVP
jgi:hypothetical protein